MANIHNLPLEGDGIAENLYQYLWTKDELDDGPRIGIPDTIVYKYRQPAAWYFTSVDGSIKKKNKANLINVRIEEAFLRKRSGSDIVAYYISSNHASREEERETTIEYLTEDTFRQFLYQRTKVNNGVLQRFVEPKGIHNSMTRVIWSPKVCMLERRCNRLKLHDTRLPLYQRAVTYDGEEHNSVTVPVRGSRLPAEVQRICESIVSHVAEVSFQKFKISRMVLNLKIDPSGKIWLLWCSSLRVDGVAHGSHDTRSGSPSGVNTPMLKLPSRHAHLIKPPSKRGPLNIGATVTVPKTVRLTNVSSPSTWAEHGPDGDLSAASRKAKSLGSSGRGLASRGSGRSGGGRRGKGKGKRGKRGKKRSYADDDVEEVVDPLTDLCPSCGNRADIDHMYDVQYKTLVQHYEQLLLLLGLRPVKDGHAAVSGAGDGGASGAAGGTIPRESVWPPRSLVQSAAGGVGIFGLYPDGSGRGAQAEASAGGGPEGEGWGSSVSGARLPPVGRIPPIIARAHPKLTPEDYRRYRRDPLFLYKTMTACEDCFLVYAEVASNLMQGMEPGSAVHRVMGRRAANASRRRHVPLPVVEGARYSRLRARERAEQAQMDALRGDVSDLPPAGRTVRQAPRTFYPSHTLPPAVPQRMPVDEMTGLTSTLRTSLTTGSLGELPAPVGAELASRQHAFYATLSQNPNLHKGHPLSHMVTNSPAAGGARAPGTAPLGGSRSAPAVGAALLPRDAVTAPSMSERHMVAPSNVGQFSTLQAPAAYDTLDQAPQAWGSGSLRATRGGGASRRDAMAKVEARGGATLRAYNSPPSSAAELSGPTGVGGRGTGKHRSRRRGGGGTRGSRASAGLSGGGSGAPSAAASRGGFGTSASKHQDFLSQMTKDVKGRLDYPEPLLGEGADGATRADGGPKASPADGGPRAQAKTQRSKAQRRQRGKASAWREAKAAREAAEAEEEAGKKEAEAKARRQRQAAYKRRLKQRDVERKRKQEREEENAKKAAMRAEEEKKAREHYRRSLRKAQGAGSGSRLIGKDGKPLRRRPREPDADPGVLTEGRSDYRSLYEQAAAEAAADVAALRGDDGEGRGEGGRQGRMDAADDPWPPLAPPGSAGGAGVMTDGEMEVPHLRCATPWKIGGLQTVVHAELFPSDTPLSVVGVEDGGVVAVPDTVAVDVSAFYWQRPSTGTEPTPATAPPYKPLDSDAAPTHNPDNFTRGIIRLDVHDTVSQQDHSVAIRMCVYALPAHPDGLPPPAADPPITTPLPHVVLLSRVLEACYYEQPPSVTGEAAPDGAGNRLQVDSEFICADAVNPSGRHRPIMCHARKFGKDMVIVSLHTVEASPGQGDVESATSPRFVLQAYNYTKRKFIAANLTREQLLKSNKPFLKQAAQVYFANLENRPASPASRPPAATAAAATTATGDGAAR